VARAYRARKGGQFPVLLSPTQLSCADGELCLFISSAAAPIIRRQDEVRLDLAASKVHFLLWHFIQGSIMIPETRIALHRACGMCERHISVSSPSKSPERERASSNADVATVSDALAKIHGTVDISEGGQPDA
jgi:hypothetical protein